MGCMGGCLNGPLSLKHGVGILGNIDKFGERANNKNPDTSINRFLEKSK
jgi:iron only hydrogenase large subunit-like protein